MKKLHILAIIYPIVDLVFIFGITFLSFLGTYSSEALSSHLTPILFYCGGLSILTISIFIIFKLYKIVYVKIGFFDTGKVLAGSLASSLLGLIVLMHVDRFGFEKINVIGWALSTFAILFAIIGLRFIPLIVDNVKKMIRNKNKTIRTMIIGAGDAAKIIIDDFRTNPNSKNKVVVMLDDNAHKIDTAFSSIPIKGPVSNAPKYIKEFQIEEVIIAIAYLTEQRLQ